MRHILLALALIPTTIQQAGVWACFRDQPFEEPVVAEPAQVKCLATMVYGEARGETAEGQVAVAYTAVNRALNSPKSTVCKQVLKPMQYSAFNDNAALKAAATSLHLEPIQRNSIDKANWLQAVQVATMVLEKSIPDPTKGSVSYLAPKVMKLKGYRTPKWAKVFAHTVEIGNHKFYKPVDKVVASL